MAHPQGAPPQARLALARQFFAVIPHGRLLGLEPVEVGENTVLARLPYAEEIVGNPDNGVIHGGVITTLVDQTSGAAVLATLGTPEQVATLDLRIDYLHPACPEADVLARAECYKVTGHICFVRCQVFQDHEDDPIATSMSTFMRAAGEGPGLVEGAAPWDS